MRALGYRDSMYRMQFRDGCIGDLLEFQGQLKLVLTGLGSGMFPNGRKIWNLNCLGSVLIVGNHFRMIFARMLIVAKLQLY